MKKGLVSVVMAAYNAEKYICEAIESILHQTYSNWELIIVNDGSTDQTQKLIEAYANEDQRIRVVTNKHNLGIAPSANIGIKDARGEFVARLDADDVAELNRFEKQVEYLISHPDIALVGSSAYIIDKSGRRIGTAKVVTRTTLINLFMTRVNVFIHSSILVRKECVDSIGGYREKFRNSLDYDFILRLSEKYKLANLPYYLVNWRVSGVNQTLIHHSKQRAYFDIAREFALERRRNGCDCYESADFDKKVKMLAEKNYWAYFSDYNIYSILFMKQYKEGLKNLINCLIHGGFPTNSLMQGIISITSRI